MNLAFQFEPAVGSRSGTDNASVTHGVPSLCRLLHGIWSLALLAARGFIDEGAEDAVQLARLFAIGNRARREKLALCRALLGAPSASPRSALGEVGDRKADEKPCPVCRTGHMILIRLPYTERLAALPIRIDSS